MLKLYLALGFVELLATRPSALAAAVRDLTKVLVQAYNSSNPGVFVSALLSKNYRQYISRSITEPLLTLYDTPI